ncbi:acetate kinase [Plasticicumulans lactativorans]|uniref:Acetate kinase n=1 Tax=Plasticicumulans lactativorans TaxID=1133106 RepID=A0A4R2LBZ0_9GAMM|nr:acetate/propionate family kinase [Plasticicumulans lactativorans]TCO80348.1 acetate kinase [Plasticicumulans lactativorans]
MSAKGNGLLVLNAGSSSIKFGVYAIEDDHTREVANGLIENIGSHDAHAVAKDADGYVLAAYRPTVPDGPYTHQHALADLLRWLGERPDFPAITAVGHRVVHGGTRYAAPVRVDAEVRTALGALVPLAPLHQPHNLAGIDAITELDAALPQVACFDTAFHCTQPALARLFAIPKAYRDEGVQRYGFHGLSYEFVAGHLSQVIGAERAGGKVVIAHLGNGASMCAIEAGRSVASTMGFTAVEGLPMGTRTGALDPGVLLYLIERHGLGPKQLTDFLYKQSGLLGLSGLSNDMRTLLASDDPDARQAVDYFCYRIARELGSLAAALGGLDALVFTGGIGEHAAAVREQVCRRAAWLGVDLDAEANAAGRALISTADSRVVVAVVPTDEEGVIAAHTRRLVSG